MEKHFPWSLFLSMLLHGHVFQPRPSTQPRPPISATATDLGYGSQPWPPISAIATKTSQGHGSVFSKTVTMMHLLRSSQWPCSNNEGALVIGCCQGTRVTACSPPGAVPMQITLGPHRLKAERKAFGREGSKGKPPGPTLSALPCLGDFQFSKGWGHSVSVFSFPSHREKCYSLWGNLFRAPELPSSPCLQLTVNCAFSLERAKSIGWSWFYCPSERTPLKTSFSSVAPFQRLLGREMTGLVSAPAALCSLHTWPTGDLLEQ